MKVSSKSRYGIRALVDLGINAKEEQIALAEVAERQNISIQYLEQVFSALRKAGLIKSIKGAKGGYLLGKKPEEMTLYEIIQTLDGNIAIMEIAQGEPLEKGQYVEAAVRESVWKPLDDLTEQFLKSITIKDLMLKAKDKKTSACDMYYI